MYDYRGIDGTGTSTNPVSSKASSNYVEYIVRKLADGNCWMSENLKLALVVGTPIVASSNDGGTLSWTPTSCSANGNCAFNGNTKKSNGVYVDEWYYTWFAATAGSGTVEMQEEEAEASICPKGWRLPASHTKVLNRSYGNLFITYGIINDASVTTYVDTSSIEKTPFSFKRYGEFSSNGKSYYVNEYGMFWTSTAAQYRNASRAYSFEYTDGYIAESTPVKMPGDSVRCVAI